MKKEMSKSSLILITSTVGIIGILLTIASDIILLGRPVSTFEFIRLNTSSMISLNQWRLVTGTFLGIMALPLQIVGLWHIYLGLRPAGKKWAYTPVLILAHALAVGAAFHGAYVFIGTGLKAFQDMGNDPGLHEMVMRFEYYWRALVIILISECALGSLLFSFAIVLKNTLYPKWMAVLNPVTILILSFLFIMILPAPAGGFIGPTSFNMATFMFTVMSATIVYRRCK